MKKQLIVALLALATCVSAFGQGLVIFSSTKAAGAYYAPNSQSAGSPYALGNGQITVGFMWANAGTPAVGSGGSPTNSNVSANWDTILTDPAFHLATNQTSGLLVSQAVNNSGVAQGGWSYNGGASFALAGATAGSTIQAFVVAWSSAFATPQLAQQGNSFVGWGNTISYATGIASTTATFASSGSQAFGVQPVPEPSTFALAGLGAAAMLIFRRRK